MVFRVKYWRKGIRKIKDYMKKYWFLFWLSFSYIVEAQPPVKLYAYSRETSPGTVRINTDNNHSNPVISAKRPLINYYVFVEYRGSAIQPGFLWIKGHKYEVQFEKKDSSPILLSDYGADKNSSHTVLGPSTRSNLMAVTPLGNSIGGIPKSLSKLSRSHPDIIF